MEENNINKIISNALVVNKETLSEKIKPIIKQLQTAIEKNKDMIEEANIIDKKNDNGFDISLDVVRNIFSNLEKENTIYGEVTLSQKDEDNKIIYGKQIMDIGNVIVINDGNPYTTIEMTIRNIMAGNTTIFSNNGYMYGTNQLLIKIMQSVLEQFEISKYMVQIYVTEDIEEVLKNFANIDLVVCIGDHDLQRLVLSKSKNRTIISGYENFDLYIEDDAHFSFLNEILKTGLKIQPYIKSETRLGNENAMYVSDIDEAIAQINYTGSRYSAAIFTKSKENASKFIKEVKSKIVTVNTSPTIERILDIKQRDLVNEKTVIYPYDFKTKETTKIEID